MLVVNLLEAIDCHLNHTDIDLSFTLNLPLYYGGKGAFEAGGFFGARLQPA